MADAKATDKHKYKYQSVAGAGVWGCLTNLQRARQAVAAIRLNRPDAEVERVLVLPSGGRRYWRWRGGRWSVDGHFENPTQADLSKWDFAPSIARMQ